ncbi:MAG TPA: hypothetical protein V6D23_05200, partial [Candidatus Obscuribacterales bacterium]
SHLLEPIKSLGTGLSRGLIVSALDQLLRTSDRLHHCAQPDIWLEADLICLCLQGERSLLERLEALEQGAGPILRQAPPARQPERPAAREMPVTRPEPVSRPEPVLRPEPVAAVPEPEPLPDPHALPERPEPVWVEPPAQSGAPAPVSGDLASLWRAFLEKVKETQRPLIGFLLNGKLVAVQRERQLWVLEFNSKPHCERIRQSLKNGKLQQLASAIMGEPYGIDARLAGEGPGLERLADRHPEKKASPPALSLVPPEPAAPIRTVQEPVATYRAEPRKPAFEDDIDMDFLPEDPAVSSSRPVTENGLHSPEPAGQAEAAGPPVATRPAPPEVRQALPEVDRPAPQPRQAPPTVENPAQAAADRTAAERSLRDPAEVGFARRHPVEAVAELFKGKVIHRR